MTLGQDLPDMTPHQLLHHPLFHTYLTAQLPNIPHPMATDLHPSLANLDHLDAMINTAIKSEHPEGTGWNGTLQTSSNAFHFLQSIHVFLLQG